MDLGPGGTRSPGPSGFGGGYNATTSSNTGVGMEIINHCCSSRLRCN
jgi:hypothetical protein